MLALVIRRLAILVPTLLLLSFAVFLLSLGLRSDRAAETRAGENASVAAIEQAKADLHLDDPLMQRYGGWLGNAVQGDFGRSFVRLETVEDGSGSKQQGVTVSSEVTRALPRTAALIGVAFVFGATMGMVAGIIGGTRPGSLADRVTFVFSAVGLAVPSFWIGMLLVSLFAVRLGWLPAVGYVEISEGGYWAWFEHLLIPGLALGFLPAAIIARQTRAALADVMGSTYIRTAWAKGASLRRVVFHHALKNAASAPLTVFGLVITALLGGTVIIESLFGIDGIGALVVTSVRSSDVPMLQGIVMAFIIVTMFINLLIDIAYGLLDPRVRIT